MFKSKLALLLVILTMLALVVPVSAQEPAIAPVACEEPGELTMWVWDEAWQTIISDSIELWKETYCPGAEVTVEVQPWAQYWDLLRTNAAGGDIPDVFTMSQTNVRFYLENDVLLNLQPYWDEFGVDTTMWGSGMVDPYRWGENGDLYAAPVNWDTIAIFYNKDLFDAAGLDYPTAGWTWDDFAAAAEALTDPDNGVWGAEVYLEFQAGYPNWIAATGETPIIDAGRTECMLDNPGNLEALNFLKGLYDAGYMPSVTQVGDASPDTAFNLFASGKLGMVAGGSWKLPVALEEGAVPFEWDIVQLPTHLETGRSRSILHAVGYVASSRTENPDLAANLILFLASDEGQRFFAEGGSVAPANPSPEIQQLWIDSFGETDKNIQAFVDATVDSQGVTVFDEIWDPINSELVVNIFDLGVSVEDAVAMACEAIDPYLVQE